MTDLEVGDEPAEDLRYGTRWGVAGAALVPVIAVLGAVGILVSSGVLALSLVAQSGSLALSTNGLRGNNLGITVIAVSTGSAHGAVTRYEARIGVGTAQINGLCIAQPVSVAGVPFTLLINAGDDDRSTFETTVNGLLLDATQANGDIGASGNLAVNKNGADVTLGSSGIALNGSSDAFGLQADGADLTDIEAIVRDITVPNLLQTPDFRIRIVPDRQTCPAPK